MSDINTITMNVSLPEPLKKYVDGNVATGLYGSASEFVREAIREKLGREHEREQARASLKTQLLAGLDSGRPIPFDDDYAARKKTALRIRQRGKGGE